jgi:hypothetical protein
VTVLIYRASHGQPPRGAAAAVGALVALALFTAVPARLGARGPVAVILRSEAA